MASQRRNRERRPARNTASREPKRRLLVVCEGKVTEPTYLRGLERLIRNAKLVIDIPPEPQGSDPRTLVEWAQDLSQKATELACRENDPFLAYDEVWCVFDVDEHPPHRMNDVRQLATAHGVKLAVSNPCFELWLLLHFRESPGSRHRHELQRMLGGFIAGYDKRFPFEMVAPGVDDAMRRAQRLDRTAKNEGEPGRNPTTGVYLLADSIARG